MKKLITIILLLAIWFLSCKTEPDNTFQIQIDSLKTAHIELEDRVIQEESWHDSTTIWIADELADIKNILSEFNVYPEAAAERGQVEFASYEHLQGDTFHDSFIILDEAQNITMNQMEMMLGRLGKGSTMVICGDQAQIDLRHKKDSGFGFLYTLEAQVQGFKVITLKQNHRHTIVEPILKVYENYR